MHPSKYATTSVGKIWQSGNQKQINWTHWW